eukprot:CAMPEP_0176364914 /NCGR_PEP_ID=MMETSP0126-20121128/20112_1 /TAXON_ID=141414 ORGANISM="Strombidinopsis acuminatum, Strain SPMC142" /NCGR_SAMPLE_ID=MMETSP0126 /ASSEMBLY_ACC=CAM_ASM_000229 /LENGTH=109 /DNA_ID=CAMNT_0017721723 /DNA_START=40 /DNA_END=369 /DNA_ORIENTATION=-
MIADRQEPGYLERRDANHKKFFAEADKNNDGMLDRDEYTAYVELWNVYLKKKFEEDVPMNAELSAEGFDAIRVTGKEGVTQEDYDQCAAWAEEIVQATIAAQNAQQQQQ